MIRALLLALVLPCAAVAQAPRATVTLKPDGPVTVGTPIAITVTVLVPTWMPDPPAWPDLQVADAITRFPDRATRPVTERVDRDTWSGVARTWQVIPQGAGDYDLGQPQVTVTYADPRTSRPTEATLDLPPIAFSATIPAAAAGMDPFLPATALTVAAAVDGLPATPKPGDAFTLTLTTAASGPASILLPPLVERLPTPAGLRAYPREPALTDGRGATRTEAVTYVVERPGTYVFPAVTIEWWNTDANRRETAASDPVSLTVPAPPGWRNADGGAIRLLPIISAALIGAIAVVVGLLIVGLRRRGTRPPSEARLYRALRHAIRSAPAAEVRRRLSRWRAALPDRAAVPATVETAMRALERSAYGPSGSDGTTPKARHDLLRATSGMRLADPRPPRAVLPELNPPLVGVAREYRTATVASPFPRRG